MSVVQMHPACYPFTFTQLFRYKSARPKQLQLRAEHLTSLVWMVRVFRASLASSPTKTFKIISKIAFTTLKFDFKYLPNFEISIKYKKIIYQFYNFAKIFIKKFIIYYKFFKSIIFKIIIYNKFEYF